mmetsp:Transcript_95802/g.209564  ORF Transcript_95802/g.209564 Transcript_95802/m.209564 type:complete len:293 (-) Transcript_95802:328-1206(-)
MHPLESEKMVCKLASLQGSIAGTKTEKAVVATVSATTSRNRYTTNRPFTPRRRACKARMVFSFTVSLLKKAARIPHRTPTCVACKSSSGRQRCSSTQEVVALYIEISLMPRESEMIFVIRTAMQQVSKEWKKRRLEKYEAASSMMKIVPASGAQKAAATPAPAPIAAAWKWYRRGSLASSKSIFAPHAPPNLRRVGRITRFTVSIPTMVPAWIIGPSGPTKSPAAHASAVPKTFTTSTGPLNAPAHSQPFKNAITPGMPLLAAVGCHQQPMQATKVIANATSVPIAQAMNIV